MRPAILNGDCLHWLPQLASDSVDAVITDPPYGIGFMGKAWDQPGQYGSTVKNGNPGLHNRVAKWDNRTNTARDGAMEAGRYDFSANAKFQAWVEAWATELLRVLKPGGHLISFGGSRTWHRLAAGIEDAGFEMRDSIAWLYGSGFPKSLDVSKAIDKAAGATREVVGAGQPFGAGSMRNKSRVEQGYRPTEINPEGGAAQITAPATPDAEKWQGWGTALKPSFEPIVVARKPLAGTVAANVLAHGTGALNIDATRIATTDKLTGSGTPPLQYGGANARPFHENAEPRGITQNDAGRWPTNVLLDGEMADALDEQAGTSKSTVGKPRRSATPGDGYRMTAVGSEYADSGGASRFFPTFRYQAKAPTRERPRVDGVAHPTVKPLELMRWLVRLVTPPDGVVLDPFAGSGTTLEAVYLEGFNGIGIEREADYMALIEHRLQAAYARTEERSA